MIWLMAEDHGHGIVLELVDEDTVLAARFAGDGSGWL